mgnify:CR=1 FL=1
MLTKDLLRVSRAGGGYHLQFADVEAERLAARVLGVYQGHVGESRETLQSALADLEREADDFKLVRGFAKLVEREATFETRAPVDPVRARRRVFEAAERIGVVSEGERDRLAARELFARDAPLVAEPVEGLTVTAVNTGVPHAVAFVDGGRDDPDGIDAVDLDAVAPPVRHADVFPEGANVTLASRAGDRHFRQRTFERGVEGETQACGTGAVAVAAAAKRLGRLPNGVAAEDWVRVSPPGGDLSVAVPDDGPARLRGPAVKQFEGELPAAPSEERVGSATESAALDRENEGAEE